MMQTTENGVHCKVICENDIRRFLFVSTEFGSLKGQIQRICSINTEFVLKYSDDEGDMITLSTDNELSFALSCMDNRKVLRLCVVLVDAPAPEKMEVTCPIVEVGCGKKWKRKSGCGRGKKWNENRGDGKGKRRENKERCGGRWKNPEGVDRRQIKIERLNSVIERLSKIPKEEGNFDRRQEKIQKLEHKLNWIQNHANLDQGVNRREMKIQRVTAFIERLSKVPKEEGNYERRQQRIQKLQEKLDWIKAHPEEFEKPKDRTTWHEKKVNRLTACIERLEKVPKEEGNFEKRQAKVEHLRKKLTWMQSHPQGCPKKAPYTPEQKEQIEITRIKIRSLKETICPLKSQIRAKRTQLSTAEGTQKETLINEISILKTEVNELKTRLAPLRQEICQLYHRN